MGALDVQVIAAALGGGGHAKAAGATVKRGPFVMAVAVAVVARRLSAVCGATKTGVTLRFAAMAMAAWMTFGQPCLPAVCTMG